MKQDMVVNAYWLKRLVKKWEKIARLAQKEAENHRKAEDNQYYRGLVRAYRKAAEELKETTEIYELPADQAVKQRPKEATWSCCLPAGAECPLEGKIPVDQDIMLIDCMTEDCPYLKIKGYTRLRPADNGKS